MVDVEPGTFNISVEEIEKSIPDRLDDFKILYKNEKRKKLEYLTYTISDYLINLKVTNGYDTVVDSSAAFPKFQQQVDILNSIMKRFESSLFDIKQIVQADLFDTELEAAAELRKKKFFRGAGAIAGVVLEKHLSQVCLNHDLKLTKKNPTIWDFNELLKKEEVIEVKDWRFIQHLGDLRNLCDHNKDKEPTDNDIDDLILGVKKISKTIY